VGAVFAAVGQAGRTGHGGQGSGTGYSLALLVETMAQGALAALADPSGGGAVPDGASLRLAGVDDARLISPVVPGDRLTVEATVEGRFAALAKVACRLLRDGEPVAEAKLLLAGDWSRA
jgi:3-hydroxyacyl-[acyl-carrier-protein] dehydratase